MPNVNSSPLPPSPSIAQYKEKSSFRSRAALNQLTHVIKCSKQELLKF